MRRFKNLITFILVLSVILLVGCTTTKECTNHYDNDKDGKCDVCTTPVEIICTTHNDGDKNGKCDVCGSDVQTQKPEEPKYNFLGAEFIIEVDQAASADPRNSNYKGIYQKEKQDLIEAAEKKYNIKIVYKTYPSSASWGGARERYITENNIAGTPTAHIYQMPSMSVGTLATQNAICELSSYIEKYGNKLAWDKALEFGRVMGGQYSYSDGYPMSTEGIFYNTGLLAKYLGEERATEPTDLWLEGKWDWNAFEKICKELDQLLAADEFVLGGMGYNWAYQMLGANGVHIVDNELQVGVASQESIDTLVYMNELFNSVKWDHQSVALSNATSTEMIKGKVAFHNGQTYWITNKWTDNQNEPIDFGFVPYPYGPNASNEDGSMNPDKYWINDVYGQTQYVISAAYSKELLDPAYWNLKLHDEIIFQIWSELQYFPEEDPATKEARIEDYTDEYALTTLEYVYAHEQSIDAHLSVITKGYPDYFYSLDEAKGHVEGSYMLIFQSAIVGNPDDIRGSMVSLEQKIKTSFKEKFKLSDDFYE